MDRSSKLYKKAVNLYNDGELYKALDFCEKSISLSLNNTAALNLKGLLLYLNGDMEEAKSLWKLNKDHNRDQVSKKYLENLIEDEGRLPLFQKALRYIETMEFKEALVLLKECTKSDFNAINVYNALTTVYIHLGNYVQAKAAIEKVLSIDKHDKSAMDNRKLLLEYKVIEKQSNKRAAFMFTAILLVAAVSWYMADFRGVKKQQKANIQDSNKAPNVKETPVPEKNNDKAEASNTPQKSSEGENKTFPKTEIDTAVNNKDYNALVKLMGEVKPESLQEGEKETYYRAEAALKSEGVAFFYDTARKLHTEKRYTEALTSYENARKYGGSSYLYSNVIFMMGACYEAMKDTNKALEYYNQYLDSRYDEVYKNNYNSTILYSLLMMYKDSDSGKAKAYAEEIRKNYKDSIYNNSVVDSLLK